MRTVHRLSRKARWCLGISTHSLEFGLERACSRPRLGDPSAEPDGDVALCTMKRHGSMDDLVPAIILSITPDDSGVQWHRYYSAVWDTCDDVQRCRGCGYGVGMWDMIVAQ